MLSAQLTFRSTFYLLCVSRVLHIYARKSAPISVNLGALSLLEFSFEYADALKQILSCDRRRDLQHLLIFDIDVGETQLNFDVDTGEIQLKFVGEFQLDFDGESDTTNPLFLLIFLVRISYTFHFQFHFSHF